MKVFGLQPAGGFVKRHLFGYLPQVHKIEPHFPARPSTWCSWGSRQARAFPLAIEDGQEAALRGPRCHGHDGFRGGVLRQPLGRPAAAVSITGLMNNPKILILDEPSTGIEVLESCVPVTRLTLAIRN
ncbi:MAG: hypothetical protein MZV70_44920 [Desulfobacterales bacterium]|nr:hypothetical protein [Desulfobacterales bacterium]